MKRKRSLLALFLVAWVVSCLYPPYPGELVLQHVPTVLAVVALVAFDRYFPLSVASYVAILAFLCLHVLGARYLYSNVPYDDWSRTFAGTSLSGLFGWQRNHYDRLVHFAYGLLLVGPMREMLNRFAPVPRAWSWGLAIACVMATSATYELIEWTAALVLSAGAAEAYNGQQGDMWDAQKDMALALGGALLAALLGCRRASGPSTGQS